MNGNRFLLDTNAIIILLKGNPAIDNLLLGADWIAASVISIIEFLSFAGLTERDKILFYKLIDRIKVVLVSDENISFLEFVATTRINTGLKLPDAIIAATAIYNNAVLVTNDKGFSKISSLKIQPF